ncbi:MAG: HNH endonuclease [Spirulina sp.]
MTSERISKATRKEIAKRANYSCEYCQCPEKYIPESFTIDHIIPRKEGGGNRLDNLAWSCLGCNSHKHTKTTAIDPQTEQNVTLFNPRQQVWTEHFNWSDDLTQIIGKTPCGRATVKTLKLNRVGLVNLRELLRDTNKHPAQLV